MDVLMNHCFCLDSNWGGEYNGRLIVGIDRIVKGKTFYDPPSADWVNLIERHELVREKFDDPYSTNRLKPEVMVWLKENVNGRRWAVGTDTYNSRSPLEFNVFFQSYRDVQRFIKRWSEFGKPLEYVNYFRSIRKRLDMKSMTLKVVSD